jgi:hypothetical protein
MASKAMLHEVADLIDIFSRYNQYTDKRTKSLSDDAVIYLSGKTCPSGTRPCDPSQRQCPSDEIAIEPDMRTVDGFRCYSEVNLNKPRTEEEIKNQHTKIMEFVEKAAKLTAAVKGKLDMVKNCGSLKSENLCGMKDMCSWSDGVCSSASPP